jgi:hypothetical protein
MARAWAAVVVGTGLVLGGAGEALAQATTWIHASVETRGAAGEQVSTFRARTTTDQAGTQPVAVSRLCVKGIGHQVQEKCESNVASVELVERTLGLPGVGTLCVEAVASAESSVGPLSANARACPQ